jgi:hypothetical protein
MLFIITDELVSQAELNSEKERNIIEKIAESVRYGKHQVYAKRDILNRLINISTYENTRTKDVYNYLLVRYSTFANIVNLVCHKVFFVINEAEKKIIKDDLGRFKEVYIPIDYITDNEIFGSAFLLGENDTEIRFYMFLCEYYKKKENVKLPTRHTPDLGGGNTISGVIKSHCELKKCFCLTLVDSDKKYPNATYGDTLKNAIKKYENFEFPFNCGILYSDEIREIENLIPISILKKISSDNVDWNRGFDIIEKNNELNHNVNYFDLKKGMSKNKYCKILDPKHIDYVNQFVKNSNLMTNAEFASICNVVDEENDEILLHGLGDKVLERAIAYINEMKPDFSEHLDLNLEKIWFTIGKHIFSWTCASEPIRL